VSVAGPMFREDLDRLLANERDFQTVAAVHFGNN
jgi:hypothetical protein